MPQGDDCNTPGVLVCRPQGNPNLIRRFINAVCNNPAASIAGQLQLNSGFWSAFGFEGQVSLSFTSHGQVVWTQTAGGVFGVNNGLVLSGGVQFGGSLQNPQAGFSRVSTLGARLWSAGGDGFSAGASETTDASGLTINAGGKFGFAAGAGLVSGVDYQTGLAVASPSLCSLLQLQ